MLFNSIEYLFFLPIVFLIYWAIGYAKIDGLLQLKMQNAFVVVASYIFYGWWDWRFLILIAFTSLCSYASGILIERGKQKHGIQQSPNSDSSSIDPQSAREQAPGQTTAQSCAADTLPDTSQKHASLTKNIKNINSAKAWMITNIVINLGILATFKYYDFFVSEFGALFGVSTDSLLLRIILPVGISFYTFQALSYSIDVYRGKITPTKDIIAFLAFIAFFPQLVAGPIERATNLLSQFLNKRTFSYDQATDGMRQILWGLFKKIVVADNCATYVDQVWAAYDTQTGSTLLLAAVLFAFQIYGDFSGYSDMAIGTAKLFGIKLMRNFNNPYFSRDIAEFWRRWHISLTTWFRDYVYVPLGGSRVNKQITMRNTCIVFLLCGLWHGANWTFIAWGVYHALLFLPLILLGRKRKYSNPVAEGLLLPTWKECVQIFCTFFLVVLGWIIFRAETVSQSWEILRQMCSHSLWTMPYIGSRSMIIVTVFAIAFMMLVEWVQRNEQHGLALSSLCSRTMRYAVYLLLIAMMLWNTGSGAEFIYFQF